jgi:very-short-patch-repair endonuclease
MYKLNRSEGSTQRARVERQDAGATERLLWGQLENDLLGVRFRRQYACGKYLLDFYCAKARLCIEVDGPHHLARIEKDEARDAYLAKRGILTLRFTCEEIWTDLFGTVERIREETHKRVVSRGLQIKNPLG